VPSRVIRVSAPLIAVEQNNPNALAGGERRRMGRSHNQAIGASELGNEGGVLRGQGAYDSRPILSPFGASPHVVLARSIGLEHLTEHSLR
jgi:hypothetical protein